MAHQKNQTALLPPPFLPPSTSGPLATTLTMNAVTRQQRQIVEECLAQRTVIEAQASKTLHAQRMQAITTQYTADIGVHTLEHIECLQAQNSSPMVQAFCDRIKQTYAYQTAEAVFICGALQNEEVARRLYQPSERKRGWFD